MKKIKGSYVLILAYVDNNWMDIGGNLYPIEGYVEAKTFTEDIDIRFGLSGILWGKTHYLPYEKIDDGHWAVVKTELNENLIKTDWYLNRYKFKSGFVGYSGNLRSASKYIMKNKDNGDFLKEAEWLLPEDIAGSAKWMKERGLKNR